MTNGTEEIECLLFMKTAQGISAVLLAISVFLFIVLVTFTFQLRNAFHPFFSCNFVLILIFYIICITAIIAYKLLEIFEVSNQLAYKVVIDFILWAYYVITPINICCVLERIVATVHNRQYEMSRNYVVYVVSIAICFGFASWLTFSENVLSDIIGYLFLFLTLASLLAITVLQLVNQRLTRDHVKRGGSKLTERYQLAENIKAMRAILPFVLLDNCITINDMLWSLLFEVTYETPPNCNDTTKVIIFTLSTLIRTLVSYAQPLYILWTHELYRKKLFRSFNVSPRNDKFRMFQTRRLHPTMNMKKLTNVLGGEIKIIISQDEYFHNLKALW